MARKARTAKILQPYYPPGFSAASALHGHANSAAIYEIIGRAPDAHDMFLDDPRTVALDEQGGYWFTVEDDYSEESIP